MELVLHIGNHKTGSTAIQSVLSANCTTLENNSVLYPEIGRFAGAHHLLATTMKKTVEKHIEEFSANQNQGGAKIFEEFLTEITLIRENAKHGKIIFSSEEFFNVNNLDIDKVEKLFSLFNKVTIVCYLRNQVEHIESTYKFSVAWDSSKEHRQFDDFVAEHLSSNYHEYLGTLRFWSQFKNTTVKCLAFDEAKSNLIDSFLDAINLGELKQIMDTTKTSKNESVPLDIVMLYRFLNSKNLNSEQIRKIERSYKAIDDTSTPLQFDTLLTYDQYIQIRDRFKVSNQALHQEFKINLNRYIPDPKDKAFRKDSVIMDGHSPKQLIQILVSL
tara:strand:- start:6666 stop:7655 length:990 start_codon:yes stop_codon:yes gene_type:complete